MKWRNLQERNRKQMYDQLQKKIQQPENKFTALLKNVLKIFKSLKNDEYLP